MKLSKNVRIVVGAVLLTLLAVVILQNSGRVTLTFVNMHFQLPVFLVILISAAIGLGVGWLMKWMR